MKTNQNSLLKKLIAILVVAVSGILLTVPLRAQTSTATLYLSPASVSHNNATEFNLAVRVNTNGNGVNAVQADLTYTAADLDFVSIDTGGSAFSISASETGGSGSVSIARAHTSDVNGDHLIATVRFRTKKGSGSSTVNFANSSAVIRTSDSQNIVGTKTGATVNFTTPPEPDTTPPTVLLTAPANNATVSGTTAISATATDNVGVTKVEFMVDGAVKATDTSSPYSFSLDTTTVSNGQRSLTAKAYDAANNSSVSTAVSVTINNESDSGGNTGSNSGGSSGGSSGNTGTDDGNSGGSGSSISVPIGSESSGFKATLTTQNLEFTRVAFEVAGNVPFRAYIKYSTKDGPTLTTSETGLGTSHSIALDEKLIVPGTTYTYQLVTIDENGNKAESETQSFTTKGFTVNLLLLNSKGTALKDTDVTLHSDPKQGKTNSEGHISFTDVAPGKHEVAVTLGKKTFKQEITVDGEVKESDGTQTAEAQAFDLVFDTTASWLSSPATKAVLGVLIVALLAAAVVLGLRWYNRNKPPQKPGPTNDSSSSTLTPPSQPKTPSTPTTPNTSDISDSLSEHLAKIRSTSSHAPGTVISPNTDNH